MVSLIALTGGIAAGKSTVAGRLGELGATVVDADVLAREAVEPGTPGYAAVVRRFGAEVVAADGSLDRRRLAAQVFADDTARRDLEQIIHPEVHRLLGERIDAAAALDPQAVIVYDVPLLAESERADSFDLVVVVHSERDTRLRRLVDQRGLGADEARARIDAQADDAARLAIADIVIRGDTDWVETRARVDELWARWRAEPRGEHEAHSAS